MPKAKVPEGYHQLTLWISLGGWIATSEGLVKGKDWIRLERDRIAGDPRLEPLVISHQGNEGLKLAIFIKPIKEKRVDKTLAMPRLGNRLRNGKCKLCGKKLGKWNKTAYCACHDLA
jgi:hypothetical protein